MAVKLALEALVVQWFSMNRLGGNVGYMSLDLRQLQGQNPYMIGRRYFSSVRNMLVMIRLYRTMILQPATGTYFTLLFLATANAEPKRRRWNRRKIGAVALVTTWAPRPLTLVSLS